MLSIVKMDFDSDVEILDEDLIKSETIDIEETTICDDNVSLKHALHDLELVPIVYTTKLDDMRTVYLNPDIIQPDEATAMILKESKPVLRTLPGSPRKGRKNKRKFSQLKAILEKIYRSTQKVIKNEQIGEEVITNDEINEKDIKNELIDDPVPDACAFKIDLNSVKSEVLNEPIVEKTNLKDTCKYRHLLKLCKPCSVVLVGPVLVGPKEASQVIHGGQLLKASKVQKPRFVSSSSHSRSSEDEAPLITLYPPDLLVERKSISVTKETGLKQYKGKGPKLAPKPDNFTASPKVIEVYRVKNIVSTSHVPQRFMRSCFLEMHDTFSNEFCVYYADKECNLLDYFKDTGDKAHLYQSTNLNVACRYKIENCCWVKKDEYIQSLYPKVLLYPTSRFMRKPHPCKPGACTCCCRKKENVYEPEFVFTEKHPLPSSSINQKSFENDDVEILDLEDRIDKTIININKTPSSNKKLQKLQTGNCNTGVPNSLIGKALAYKGPLPKRKVDNRRLMTLKRTDFQSTVIVLRNYAEDIIEIYEKNTDGDLISYLKTTCYRNTNQPDVQKLLNKPNSASEVVCCWFKREYVITKLQNSITLQPRAANFIRTSHTCQSNECTCCCKPVKEEIKLQSIKLPCRSQHWKSSLTGWGLVREIESESQQGQPLQTVPSIPFQTASQPASSGSMGKDNDDDCQITSIMTSPIFQPLPHQPTVPPSIFVPEAVDGDELSKEVNSLITSILERFKDVRLTINNDGKVAAALNTPVNTLSTVELKVLANILSYAQSQVDLLGSKVNSGMSLSNIINLKVDDVQSNRAPLDTKSIYKEFGKNVKLNTNVRTFEPLKSTNANNTPMAFPQTRAVPQTFTFFTNSTSVKNQHFNDAFSSYLNTTNDTNPESITPVIENVYSLKDSENAQTTEGTDEDSSFTTVWYRKPAQSSASTLAEESVKPNASKKRNDDSMTEAVQSKKIKVLSPTKLGKSEGTATTISIPNQPTASGKGVMPRIMILPNNNFNGQSLGQPHTQGMINGRPSATVSHPFIIINPMQDTAPSTANIAAMSQYQSKIPVVFNAASTSHLIDPGSNAVTPQMVTTPVSTSMDAGAGVTETPEQNPFPENDPDIHEDSENGSAPEMDNDPNMDDFESEDFELKYSPENNEEEEDCILGF